MDRGSKEFEKRAKIPHSLPGEEKRGSKHSWDAQRRLNSDVLEQTPEIPKEE